MHDGHRERIRQRIIKEGTDNFEEHQLLEALLFFSIPRADTNETAHRLIDEFGSLAGVLSASREELMNVEGVGETSALLIKLVAGVNRKIALSENKEGVCYDTIGKICRYLANIYVGITVERVYMMMFDNGMKLIDCVRICDGSVNAAVMQPRVMVEKALLKHASAVVVAHNHPNGIAVPSGDDITTTEMLRSAFDLMGIQLIEHIIIAGRSYTPILRSRNLSGIKNDVLNVVGCRITFEEFYKNT
jgi:DNA repair protein RadC